LREKKVQLQQQHLIAVGKKVQLQQQHHIAAEKRCSCSNSAIVAKF